MYDEDYIVVQVWNDQVGGWFDVDEAQSPDEAREIIKQRKEIHPDKHYCIVYFQRTVIK